MPILLADRFGGWPGDYEEVDLLQREKYLNLLGIEGEVAWVTRDMGPDDEIYWAEDDLSSPD